MKLGDLKVNLPLDSSQGLVNEVTAELVLAGATYQFPDKPGVDQRGIQQLVAIVIELSCKHSNHCCRLFWFAF